MPGLPPPPPPDEQPEGPPVTPKLDISGQPLATSTTPSPAATTPQPFAITPAAQRATTQTAGLKKSLLSRTLDSRRGSVSKGHQTAEQKTNMQDTSTIPATSTNDT